jgi:DNA-binding NtrC family response regulator
MVSYAWREHVRELARTCSHLITRASHGGRIDLAQVRACLPHLHESAPNPRATSLVWEGASMEDALNAFRRELILARLERHGGRVGEACESLGLSKSTFRRHRAELGIEAPGDEDEE